MVPLSTLCLAMVKSASKPRSPFLAKNQWPQLVSAVKREEKSGVDPRVQKYWLLGRSKKRGSKPPYHKNQKRADKLLDQRRP